MGLKKKIIVRSSFIISFFKTLFSQATMAELKNTAIECEVQDKAKSQYGKSDNAISYN